MKTNKTILLVGGGTGGHIYPLRSVADECLKKEWNVHVLLNDAELDKKISTHIFSDIESHFLRTEKIRRYFDWKNFKAPLGIIKSLWTAFQLIQEIQPHAIFLKGGFVSFPILLATQLINVSRKSTQKIKIFSHESDTSAGVITVICRNFSDKIFESFGEPSYPLFFRSEKKIPEKKNTKKKQLLAFGGSQGSLFINTLIEKHLPELLKEFSVTLVTGNGKAITSKKTGFSQTEMMEAENLRKKIHHADIVISRAGANSIFEILTSKIPSILIPLPSAARDHQTKNAAFFAKQNLCYQMNEFESEKFLGLIEKIQKDSKLKKALEKSNIKNAAPEIVQEIETFLS